MTAVRDDFCAHFRVAQNVFEHAPLHGCAESTANGRDGTHRAPEMVDVSHACFECSSHFVPTAIRVAACDQATFAAREAVEVDCTREFCCACGDLNQARCEIALDLVEDWISASTATVAAGLLRCEIGSVEVNPGNPRFARPHHFLCNGSCVEHAVDLVFVARGGGGEDGRSAMAEVCPTRLADGFGRAIHEVRVEATVDMDVDESRREILARDVDDLRLTEGSRGRLPDSSDYALDAFDGNVLNAFVFQNDRATDEENVRIIIRSTSPMIFGPQ